MKAILGDGVFHEFWWSNQIVNHDSEDWDNPVDLGCDELHDPVIMNRAVFEADLTIAVFAGYAKELQPAWWEVADKRTYVPWATKKYDVMVFGMPQFFHYGNGHGTNPLLVLQAISANVIRHRRVMSDNCVVICSSICNGYFHDEEFTAYRELYELFRKDYHHTLPDLEKYGECLRANDDFIRTYRFNFGCHPYHCFSMVSLRTHRRNAL